MRSGASSVAAMGLAAAVGWVGSILAPEPLGAQGIVGLEKSPKRVVEGPERALDRLRAPWEAVPPLAGGASSSEAALAALVRLIHEPVKLVGLHRFDAEGRRAVKAAMSLAEARLRESAAAVALGEVDEEGARAAAELALEEYRSVLEAETARTIDRWTRADRP